jgi:hypothetical protein
MKKEKIVDRCGGVALPLFAWIALPPKGLQTRAQIAGVST